MAIVNPIIQTFAGLVYYQHMSLTAVPLHLQEAVSAEVATYGDDPYFDDHRHLMEQVDGLLEALASKETLDGAQEKADKVLALANTFTSEQLAALVESSPETLDTLNELAAALGNDPNFATTVANQIGTKVDKVAGKGLSSNDYTAAEKTKLAGLENFSKDYNELLNKPTIPAPVILNNTVSSTSVTQAATANAVKTAYDRADAAFQSASDGKTLLANAITGKGVAASSTDTFGVLAAAINSISTGKRVTIRTVNFDTGTYQFSASNFEFKPRIVFGSYAGALRRMFSASTDGSLPSRVLYDSSTDAVTMTTTATGFTLEAATTSNRFYGEYVLVVIE